MSGVNFLFKLLDGASNPAKAIADKLDALSKKLKNANGETTRTGLAVKGMGVLATAAGEKFDKSLGGKAFSALLKLHKGTMTTKDGVALLDAAGEGLSFVGKGLSAAMGLAADAVMAFEAALAVAAVGAVGLAAAGTYYAAKMAIFREQTEFALKYAMGSATYAKGVMESAINISHALGVAPTEVAKNLTNLIKRGYGQSDAESLVQSIEDLRALNANDASFSADAAIEALGKLKQGGALDKREFKAIAGEGVNKSVFYDLVAKHLGITAKNELARNKMVDAAMEAGKLKGVNAQRLIQQAIQKQGGGGPAGSVAKDLADNTLSGSMDKIHGAFERLFLSIQTSPAAKNIAKLFGAIAEALEPTSKTGQILLGIFNNVSSSLSNSVGAVSGGGLSKAFDVMGAAIKTVWPYLKALGGGLWDGMKSALTPLRAIFSGIQGTGSEPIKALVMAFAALGRTIGFIVTVAAEILAVMAAVGFGINLVTTLVIGSVGGIIGAIGSFVGDMIGMGASLAEGLWTGFKDAITSVASRIGDIVSLLPAAVRSALGIHSPSTVFAELGGYTAEGFAQGVEGGTGRAQGAVLSMVSPSVGGSASGGTTNHNGGHSFNVVVNVGSGAGGNAAETANAVKQATLTAMHAVMEDLALESGAILWAYLFGMTHPHRGTRR